jgi:hypothetical protein
VQGKKTEQMCLMLRADGGASHEDEMLSGMRAAMRKGFAVTDAEQKRVLSQKFDL